MHFIIICTMLYKIKKADTTNVRKNNNIFFNLTIRHVLACEPPRFWAGSIAYWVPPEPVPDLKNLKLKP